MLRLALILLSLTLAPCAQAQLEIGVCFDEADHTPYLYRDSQGQWRGATLDLTRKALLRIGLQPRWRPMPWLRCLREVEEFAQRGQAELLLYASLNGERERRFLASRALHRVQGGVWYSRLRFPQGAPLQQLADLRRHRVCGLHGHNYAWLQAHGVEEIDDGALNLRAGLLKLERERCDLLISAEQSVRGAAQLGFVLLAPDFAFQPFPAHPPADQHLLLSRASPRAEALQRALNAALDLMHAQGEAERIYRAYLPGGTGMR